MSRAGRPRSLWSPLAQKRMSGRLESSIKFPFGLICIARSRPGRAASAPSFAQTSRAAHWRQISEETINYLRAGPSAPNCFPIPARSLAEFK